MTSLVIHSHFHVIVFLKAVFFSKIQSEQANAVLIIIHVCVRIFLNELIQKVCLQYSVKFTLWQQVL